MTEQMRQLLKEGAARWNRWRSNHPTIQPDLSGAVLDDANLRWLNLSGVNLSGAGLKRANLSGVNLSRTNLRGADLTLAKLNRANLRGADLIDTNLSWASCISATFSRADLSRANLRGANLTGAILIGAILIGADLFGADLSSVRLGGADLTRAHLSGAHLNKAELRRANLTRANLSGVDFIEANLSGADLSGADLSGADLTLANLSQATCVDTNLRGANLAECFVYGVSAWNLHTDDKTVQTNLRITAPGEPAIIVDNMEVAQFLYLMLHNEKIRDVLETITSKVVLILGRFSEERKPVLDALRVALRDHPNHYVPVLFDFSGPRDRHILETVTLFARLARFVIADITDASMIRVELALIVPQLPSVPVQPVLQSGKHEFTEFDFYRNYPWVLPTYAYSDLDHLIATFGDQVVAPAEAKRASRFSLNMEEAPNPPDQSPPFH